MNKIKKGDRVVVVGILPFTKNYQGTIGEAGIVVDIHDNRSFPLDVEIGGKVIPLLYDHVKLHNEALFKPLLDLGYTLKEMRGLNHVRLEKKGSEDNYGGTTFRNRTITFDVNYKEVFFGMFECGSDRGLLLNHKEVEAVEEVCKNLGWD